MTQEIRYIPRVKWLWYICEGWTVDPLSRHHETRYMIAYRKAR